MRSPFHPVRALVHDQPLSKSPAWSSARRLRSDARLSHAIISAGLILAASTTSETRDRENGSWVVEASVDPPIVGEAMPDTAKPKLNKRLLKPPPGNHTPAENRPHLKQYYFKPGHKIRRPPGSNKITRLMKEAISAPRRPSRKEFLRRHAAGPD